MGLVVSTVFRRPNGDVIGFYISKPNSEGLYRLEDDGLTIPDLEASGFDLANPERHKELTNMLADAGAFFNENNATLEIGNVDEEELPAACLRMVQLLIRTQDLYMITKERVASTFEQEATEAIARAIGDKAKFETKTVIDEKLKDWAADVVIRAKDRDPVAVFMTRTDQRLLEAVLVQTLAQYEAKIPLHVIALLEKRHSVSRATWARAANRLSAITVFAEGHESAAERIAREAIGGLPLLH
jgi:hypothetical protein